MKVIKIPFTNKVIVDNDELRDYYYVRNTETLRREVYNENVDYVCGKCINAYIVYMISENTSFPIKIFPFGDDMEYALLCAEELCEKLNEKI